MLVPREVRRVRLSERAKLFFILPPSKRWPRLGNITNNFAVLKHTRGYFRKCRSPLVDGGNMPSFTLGHDGDDLMRVTCWHSHLLWLYLIDQFEKINIFVSPDFGPYAVRQIGPSSVVCRGRDCGMICSPTSPRSRELMAPATAPSIWSSALLVDGCPVKVTCVTTSVAGNTSSSGTSSGSLVPGNAERSSRSCQSTSSVT